MNLRLNGDSEDRCYEVSSQKQYKEPVIHPSRWMCSSLLNRIRDFFSGFSKQATKVSCDKRLELQETFSGKKVQAFDLSPLIPVGTLFKEGLFQALNNSILRFFDLQSPIKVSDNADFINLQEHFTHIANLSNAEIEHIHREYRALGIHDDYRELITAEALAQVLSYLEHMHTDEVLLPVQVDEGFKLTKYSMQKVLIGSELPITILKSDDPLAPSWIVPRGTSPYVGVRQGALKSLLADISSYKGLDDSIIDQNYDSFAMIIEGLTEDGRKLFVAGHSLGGALAVGIRIAFPEEVDKMYAFGAPGISEERYHEYHLAGGNLLHMQTLNTTGDIVPKAGRYVVGNVHTVTTDVWADPLTYHVTLSLSRPHTLALVDTEAENTSSFRSLVEGVRCLPAKIHHVLCDRVFPFTR